MKKVFSSCLFCGLLFFFMVLMTAPVAVAQNQYVVTDLGNLGGIGSYALGLNDKGQIVGYVLYDSSDFFFSSERAFIWENNKVTWLDALPNGVGTEATSINNSGVVAGLSNINKGQAPYDAVVWDHSTAPTDLHTLGGSYSFASAINDLGHIAGTSGQNLNSALSHAFLWSNNHMIDLQPLAYDGVAAAMNKRDEVVGFGGGGGASDYAFLYDGSSTHNLNNITTDSAGLTLFHATGINDKEEICGFGGVGDTHSCAFLWKNGKVTKIGPLPGDVNSAAIGINAVEQIVGYSRDANVNGHSYRNFLYSDGKLYDLEALIADRKGFGTIILTAINNLGQIVGWGSINGEDHAVLLSPDATSVPNSDLTLTDISDPADPNFGHRTVFGIVCDNLQGMKDDDASKDSLSIFSSRFVGIQNLKATITNENGTQADSRGINNVGHFKTDAQGNIEIKNSGITYFPPDEYNEEQQPSDVNLDVTPQVTRKVHVQLTWDDDKHNHYIVFDEPIVLARPPVVLVHGINNDPSAWNPLINDISKKYDLPFVTVNHNNPKASYPQGLLNGNGPVEIGAKLLKERICKTLAAVRKGETVTDADENHHTNDPDTNQVHFFTYGTFEEDGTFTNRPLAVRRVDVVAWSYGGVITRWYLASDGTDPSQDPNDVKKTWYKGTQPYTLPRNLKYGGDIRKVITMGSMWRGVPLINYANEVRFGDRLPAEGIKFGDAPTKIHDIPEAKNLREVMVALGRGVIRLFGLTFLKFQTDVPSMEVMAVNSPWMSQLIFHNAGQLVGPSYARPFKDTIAYAAIAGNNDDYEFKVDIINTINYGQSPSWFPYLGFDSRSRSFTGDGAYSDGLVPIWSSTIPGATQVVSAAHNEYASNADAQNTMLLYLSDVGLQKGIDLNPIWRNPDQAKVEFTPSDGSKKTWQFRAIEMAPITENDLYKNIGGVGRLLPQAVREIRTNAVVAKTTSSATIQWVTATASTSRVRIYLKLFFELKTHFFEIAEATLADATRLHRLVVTGLQSGTTYYYAVDSATDNSPDDPIMVTSDPEGILDKSWFQDPSKQLPSFTTLQDKPIIGVSVSGTPAFGADGLSFDLRFSNSGTPAHNVEVMHVTFSAPGFVPFSIGGPIALLGNPQIIAVKAGVFGPLPQSLFCTVTYEYRNEAGDLISRTSPSLRLK